MSYRAGRVIVAAMVMVGGGWAGLRAEEVVTNPYPGITLIKRTDLILPTPPPPALPRQARMTIVKVDLNAPEVRFKMTPPTTGLPTPVVCTPRPNPPAVVNWPCPSQEFEVVRQTTLQFLNDAHGQVAINGHFFAPFPVVSQAQAAYAYAIGLAASRGNVYSAFEWPEAAIPGPTQIYAITPDSPAVNIDPDNHATIVHRDPAFPDGKHVLEPVTLWNALSGSGQIITNGVKTIPCYVDAANPTCQLIPPGNANYSNANSWYNLINARSAIGISEDGRTLYLFTVDIRPLPFLPAPAPPNTPNPDRSQGMRVGEVADVLLGYGVHNALNLDGGGSTSMAMQDPVTEARGLINIPSDNPPRAEATSLAVYSDGLDPVTTAAVTPPANANGWNNTSVTVSLTATDLRSGIAANPPGWVDQIERSLSGAQTSGPHVVPGAGPSATTSFDVTTPGITTVTYSATDAAGNHEADKTLAVRLDGTAPGINGLPGAACVLWPPNHKMRQVAVVTAVDALSGVAPGSLQVTATSNEPPSEPDVRITPDGAGGFVVELRAERLGSGSGRVYTITATATDRADNVKTAIATCTVPHNQ